MVRLHPCACNENGYVRAERTRWMHMFGDRRRYRCTQCGADLFLANAVVSPLTRQRFALDAGQAFPAAAREGDALRRS